MLQVSRKSVGFQYGALGYILMHLIVQMARQGVVIQIVEMGQHFQVNCKKFQLFKNFPLVRSLDDDETSISLGQVTNLAPDAERQVFEGHRSGQVAFRVETFIDVPVSRAVFGGREEVRVVHREENNVWIFTILRNVENQQFGGDRLATMGKHVGVCEKC
ncbi:hypothetical protein TNCV_880471 [Trichonephila clavipes]|nr:hypothetical protein TNCV_880471 [Trichonephila clavipes]